MVWCSSHSSGYINMNNNNNAFDQFFCYSVYFLPWALILPGIKNEISTNSFTFGWFWVVSFIIFLFTPRIVFKSVMRGMLSAVASFNGPLVISPPCHLARHSVLPGIGGWKRQIVNALSLTPSQDSCLSLCGSLFRMLFSLSAACSCDCPGMGGDSTNLPDEPTRTPL